MKPEFVKYQEVLPEIVDVKHKISPATEKRTFHIHTQMEIIYPLSDNLIYRTDTNAYPLPANSFVLINTMSLHYIDYVRDRGDCNRYVLAFTTKIGKALSTFVPQENLLRCFHNQSEAPIILRPVKEHIPAILRLLDTMESYSVSKLDDLDSPEVRTRQASAMFLLGHLLAQVNQLYRKKYKGNSPKYQRYSNLMLDVFNYIHENLEDSLTVEEIADHFQISKTLLYKVSNEMLMISLNDYIAKIRINKAKSMLLNTDYSIEIISQAVGYSNISSFSRFFKNEVGVTPLRYRTFQRA